MQSKTVDGFLEQVNWDDYDRYRPPYPQIIEELIIAHHHEHSNSFHLAHDIGSGSGIFALRLAEYFEHVRVSDVDPVFLEEARRRLGEGADAKSPGGKGKFSFSNTPAEKAEEVAALGSVDMVTMMECAHWMDQDAMAASVGRSLRPGGTLVVLQYNVAPAIVGNERANAAVKRLFRFWGDHALEAGGGRDSLKGTVYLPQDNAGVDSIPLPEDFFVQEATKRIEFNIHGRGKTPFATPGQEDLVAPSRVDPRHGRREFTSDDAEGAGWRYEVDAAWFAGLVGTLEQPDKLHLYKDHLRDVEDCVNSSSNGKVEVEWTVGLLLTTRK